MGTLPNALGNLTGKEHKDLAQLQKKRTQQEATELDLRQKLEKERAQREDSRLSDPLDRAELATWRDKADELEAVERDLDAARTECATARSKLAAALNAVGGNDEDNAALTLPDHAELFELLRMIQEHASRVQSLKERIRLLDSLKKPSEKNPQEALDNLRSAAEALRAWLRARPVPEAGSVDGNRRSWLQSGLVLLAVGAGLAWFIDPWLALLAGLGAGIALAAEFMGKPTASDGKEASSDGQAEARNSFESTGLASPEAWEIDPVTLRLREMEREMAELAASMQRARDRDVEREFRGKTSWRDCPNRVAVWINAGRT